METTDSTPKEPEQKKPKRDKVFLLLFLIMTIACIIFAWMFWLQRNQTLDVTSSNIEITAESEVAKKDLQQLQTEYNALQTNDTALKSEIEDKKALIEQLQKQVKDGKYDVYKLKRETKTLRAIMQHFVVEIDSLNTMNKSLIASNDSVTTELKSERKKSSTLQTEKEKLYKMGSALKARNVTVKAYNIHGKNKQSETVKARKTDKILISFVLDENKIAPKGSRTVYIRMVAPDGKEWTESSDADHMFSFNNSKGFFAAKKNIDYQNDEMEVSMPIAKKDNEEFLPGRYLIEVNLDNTTVGSTSLELE